MGRRRAGLIAGAAATILLAAFAGSATPTSAAAGAADPPIGDLGAAFEPPPLSEPRYAVAPPSTSPAQVRRVTAADGVSLYTETWLPAPLDGAVPPERLPVVVVYTPYAVKGGPDSSAWTWLVPRGYAVTYAHVRGSGGSGGCIEQTADHEIEDGARIIEDAGTLAPWSSGAVGMYGISYPGGTQIATATGPDRARLASLKAIVSGGPVASAYEFYNHDGVPQFGHAVAGVVAYMVASSPADSPELLPDRVGCVPEMLVGSLPIDGGYSAFYESRDHTRHLERLEAATLLFHGSADRRVPAHMQAGLFDGIPATTPRFGVFGVWDHEAPDSYGFNGPNLTSPRRDWERSDWKAIVFAWLEAHLRGVDNGVAGWSTVQVQATDGQWRTASNWPTAPGPERIMQLGPNGTLDVASPTGETTYLETPFPEVEAPFPDEPLPLTTAVFTTEPFPTRLELVGAPLLEVWVRLLLPDSHVTARLEVVDATGERVTFESRTVGARSAQHLAPLDRGRFRQVSGSPAPVGTPLLMPIRFNPIDLAVPAGARLRLTVSGMSIVSDGADGIEEGLGVGFQGPTVPSGMVQPVAILHDAAHPSRLLFHLPETGSTLLDIRERNEVGQAIGQFSDAALDTTGLPAPVTAAPDPALGETPAIQRPRSLPATGGHARSRLALALAGLAVAAGYSIRRLSG